MQFSTVLVIILSLAFASSADQEGFYYGSPALGTFHFINQQNISQDIVFDTYVARPSAICVNDKNVLFANNAPPVYWPFISTVDINGDSETDIVYSSGKTPPGVTISALAYDNTTDQIFFMYEELNPNKNPFANQSYGVIQSYIPGSDEPFAVYSLNVSAKAPNSFDINPAGGLVYFTTNGVVYGDSRSFGGIYSIQYSGENAHQLVDIPQLNSTAFSISSVQYSDNDLFYILTGPDGAAIYKLHLSDSGIELIYNGTNFTPEQIVVVTVDNDANIWVRDGSEFYQCVDEDCESATEPVITVHATDSIIDFDVSDDETFLYYVGAAISSVIAVDISQSKSSSLANGISSRTSVWASSLDRRVYYGSNNRIDSFESEPSAGSNWSNLGKFPFSVDYLTGDPTSGQILVASRSTGIIYSVAPSGEYQTLVQTATSAITAQDGILYYAAPYTEYGYSAQILSCPIENCVPTQVDQSEEPIDSLAIDANGNLFYSTSTGIFQTLSGSSPAVSYEKNIEPFALAFHMESQTLYFLDISIRTGEYMISSCDVTNCGSTLTQLFDLSIPSSSSKFELNAWMVIDSQGENLYWAASSLVGEIYVANIASQANNLLVNTETRIAGIALSADDSSLFVSDGSQVVVYDITGQVSQTRQCSVSSGTVGDISVSQNMLFWSDSATGAVYDCLTDCSNCNSSSLIDIGAAKCSAWQFITVDQNIVYNQYGCGGIIQATVDGSIAPNQLKFQGLDPIADLVAANPYLIWALPYRAGILSGKISESKIVDMQTLYSGTGSFVDLIAVDGDFFWINHEADKIMQAIAGSSATDLVYQPAVGLSYYSSATESTSTATITATVSISPSVSPSTTSTTTASRTPSQTPPPSASMSNSPAPTQNITGISNSMTPTISRTPSVSQTQTPSATSSASFSSTPTPTVVPSNITSSVTPTPTSSTSMSPSESASTSFSSTATPTLSNSPTLSLSFGTTPSTTPTYTPTSSVTPSVSPSDYFYGSPSNTPGLTEYEEESDKDEDEPVISRSTWEWIVVITMFVLLGIAICLYFCWKSGVEREMALSLRLPNDD